MSEKLVYIIDSRESALSLVNELKAVGISEANISAIAKDDTPLDELPEKNAEFQSDAIPGAKRGAGIGGATGLLAGLTAMIVAPAGLAIGGAGLVLAAAGGATYGSFVSAIIGSSVSNSQIKKYEEAMERGDVLLVIDVIAEEVEKIQAMVKRNFPDVDKKTSISFIPPAI